jgi:hypothetical protein
MTIIPSDLLQKATTLVAAPPAGTYYDALGRKTA